MIARCRPLCIILYIYIYNIMHTRARTVQRSYSVVAKYSTLEYELVVWYSKVYLLLLLQYQ